MWQLRGTADKRQVNGAKVGLQHNIGLGGAAIVALYRKMGAGGHSNTGGDFKSAPVFDYIGTELKQDGVALVKKIQGIYKFQVTKGPGGKEDTWIVDAKNGSGAVQRGGTMKPDVTLTMTDSDLCDLLEGKLNPQKAFFQGLLKIKGNMGLAMKLQQLMKLQPKL